MRWRVDAHRNRRGPYTAAGSLVRAIGEHACVAAPELVAAYQLTLLSVAPEFRDWFAVPDGLTKAFTFSREGNARSWTRRLAHGVTEFCLEYAEHAHPGGCAIWFDNADFADPTDCEFIAVLLRRADPEQLAVRVGTSSDRVGEPLAATLREYAVTRRPKIPRGVADDSINGIRDDRLAPKAPRALAADYVASDCTSDRPCAVRAYWGLSAAGRRVLHQRRAAELGELNEPSLSLGAIPFHYEQAAVDPEPLLAAAGYCMRMAYYDAALDWAIRGRRLLDVADHGTAYNDFTTYMLFSLMLLGRFDELEAACAQVRATSNDAKLLAQAAYVMALMNVRFYEPARRDYEAAKGWVERALVFTERRPPSGDRVVNLAFLYNTMALVEMRQGRLDAAERLLSEALDYLAREAPDRYPIESGILLHNRARLHIAANQSERAIVDLTSLVANEPASDAYCDRGLLHQRSGRHAEALADFDAAIQWSPPYPDPHVNRAVSLTALGRREEALAEYDYVLVLEPDHLLALTNRALLLHQEGRFDAARGDVEHGLRLSPANARLLCVRGLIELKQRDLDAADRSFSAAIDADRSFPDAWANRAAVLFRRGELDAALRDLTQALALREDAATLYNRGRVLEAQRRWRDAADDYSRALTLTKGDAPHIRRHRDICHRAMGIAVPADDPPP